MEGYVTCVSFDSGPVLSLPMEAAKVRMARDFVRAKLATLGLKNGLADDIVVVTSELVTNAIKYAPSKAEVALFLRADAVRLEVRDDEPSSPVLAEQDDTGAMVGGRGLRIVTALGSRWGVEAEDGGKSVWVEFDTPVAGR